MLIVDVKRAMECPRSIGVQLESIDTNTSVGHATTRTRKRVIFQKAPNDISLTI